MVAKTDIARAAGNGVENAPITFVGVRSGVAGWGVNSWHGTALKSRIRAIGRRAVARIPDGGAVYVGVQEQIGTSPWEGVAGGKRQLCRISTVGTGTVYVDVIIRTGLQTRDVLELRRRVVLRRIPEAALHVAGDSATSGVLARISLGINGHPGCIAVGIGQI